MRSASKRIRGGSCHSTGPSFGPSASTPEARKFATGVATSRSCFRCVTKRGPLTAKTKSSGVSRAHARQLCGRCNE